MNPLTDELREQLARVVREHAGQLAASLMHVTSDFAAAEDLVQDAVPADLLRALGHPDQTRAADRRALELAAKPYSGSASL
jgi:DNA-directed RNA polymerase specialized sigma24 family protein